MPGGGGTIMKKKLLVLCTILACFLCGCQENKKSVSMYDLCQKMEAADSSLPSMLYASSAEEDAEDHREGGGKADEIAVIAVKNTADTEEAKKSLEAHKESRRKLLDQYEPEEVSRIKDGVIFTSGQYAVFIVSENSDAVRKAFEEAIK